MKAMTNKKAPGKRLYMFDLARRDLLAKSAIFAASALTGCGGGNTFSKSNVTLGQPQSTGSGQQQTGINENPPDSIETVQNSFDQTNGRLSVDYAQYLKKHDITFNGLQTNPKTGLTVGNGRMGVMIWNNDGLMMQVMGVDVSPQAALSPGNITLQSDPKIETNTPVQQVLSLYDGTYIATYGTQLTLTVFGNPDSEVMGIHVEDDRENVTSITLKISLWDVSTLPDPSMMLDVGNINAWKSVESYIETQTAGISRGQTADANFGCTLAATIENTTFTCSAGADGRSVVFAISPAKEFTIWFTSATRLNAPLNDSVEQAKQLLGAQLKTGYDTTISTFKDWWHAFWQKSFVQYGDTTNTSNSNQDYDYLENCYYLYNYMIASGSYGNYPFHFINGVLRATQDNTKWSSAYWWWNCRDVYASFLASNHPELIRNWCNLYNRNGSNLLSSNNNIYNLKVDGLWVPETMTIDGTTKYQSSYTNNIHSTGIEVALMMYSYYQYTGDKNYLSTVAYPFIREVTRWHLGILTLNSLTGKYDTRGHAHETNWNVTNPITNLAGMNALFPIFVNVASTLNQQEDLVSRVTSVLPLLAEYPSDSKKYLSCTPPPGPDHNHENVACEIIWPYNQSGIGSDNYDLALNTWKNRPHPFSDIWSPDAIQAARLGLGDEILSGMKRMLNFQNFPNGMTNNSNGTFEFCGVHLIAMNESLLQSYNQTIRVFPAIPSDPNFTTRFTLAAEGGFLITSEYKDNKVNYIGIKSLLGNSVTLVNPWSQGIAVIQRVADNSIIQTTSNKLIEFSTTSDSIYLVFPQGNSLSKIPTTITSNLANRKKKTLSTNAVGLGM